MYLNSNLPNNTVPNNLIALWWDDLNPASGGTVMYYYDSTNSRFIVSYISVPFWNFGGALTCQAVLYSSGKVELNYGTMNPGNGALNSATIGIENGTGADGLQTVYNAAYMHDNLSIRISSSWLQVSPASGAIAPGNSAVATVTCDAAILSQGTYSGNINLDSNDPDTPNIDVPVTLNVGSGGVPNLILTPANIRDTVAIDGTAPWILKAKNTGTATLNLTFADSVGWITLNTGPYNIPPGDSLLQTMILNAAGLPPAGYSTHVLANSNDPDAPVISIPVSMLVMEGGGCVYRSGDINGDGSSNLSDIVFAVNYIRGGPNPPAITCDCPPHGMIYAAADVNGDCSFNLSDLVFYVLVIRGLQTFQSCVDCPASNLPGLAIPDIHTKAHSGEVQ